MQLLDNLNYEKPVKGGGRQAIVFDIEADSLDPTQIWHLCLRKVGAAGFKHYTEPDGNIEEGLEILENADILAAHNGVNYDMPAIKKLYPGWQPKGIVVDTLACSRIGWPHIFEMDMKRLRLTKMPKKLWGRHKLEAWGSRYQLPKGDFDLSEGVPCWSPELQVYCQRDVEITDRLFRSYMTQPVPAVVHEMEHQMQEFFLRIEQQGFAFNQQRAMELMATWGPERDRLRAVLEQTFEMNVRLTPKRGEHRLSLFNPASYTQIKTRLFTRGWTPNEYNPKTGNPKVVDEDFIELISDGHTELAPLREFLVLNKRMGQLADGEKAWLNTVTDEQRIHGRITHIGTVTYRGAHAVIANVPANKPDTLFGKECRELFYVGDEDYARGVRLAGVDVSGLELRLLAHYLTPYDNGAYAREILEGDIHTANQKAAGLPTRDQAKTFIYALLYGAGFTKLGRVCHVSGPRDDTTMMALGKKRKALFLKKMPAMAKFLKDVAKAVKMKGYLTGLDGRRLYSRSPHSAPNLLLQSAGIILVKYATLRCVEKLKEKTGLVPWQDVRWVTHYHDEWQAEADRLQEEYLAHAVESIEWAGEHLGLRIPVTGEGNVGRTWAETH
jgi:DNA polymerase I-like protein with 3'-5' exonuclease and polymerase domains